MKKSVRVFWIILWGGIALFMLIIVFAIVGVFGKLPSLKELENPTIMQSSEVYAADGTLMGKYYRERGNRSNVNYRDISKHVIHALVATEDERFYDHAGIDFKATLRAVFLLGKEGGGSTISQQLAKTLLDQGSKNSAQRIIEKLKEYIVAIRLERNFTKEEIIALYLNAVPFSDNVYGIRNASRTFFQKEPDRLTVEEAALLVGTLQANYTYNPRVFPKAALERRNIVLGQMEKNHYINPSEATTLKSLPIKLNYRKLDENTGYAPYFREVIKDEIRDALKDLRNANGDKYDIYADGLKIYTTINPKMQEYAEEAVAQQMPFLQKALNRQRNIKSGSVWEGRANVLEASMKASDRWKNLEEEGLSEAEIRKTFTQKVPMRVFAWNSKREADTVMTPLDSIKYHRQMLQTAFMVMDPVTGEVRAWVGGIDFKTFKYDHANIKTKRQVGSAIKPLLYCQAMEERGFTMETPVVDQQQSFGALGMVPATGKTCTGRTMTMASALAWSRNCATAYIMKQVGPAQFASFLERIQIPTKIEPYPSIALGACDLSLYEMMWGYTIFPGRGFSTKPYFISRIEDRNGNVIKRFDFSQNRKEVVSEVTAYQMCKMMEGPVTKGTAGGLMYRLGAAEMGGKTGTTNENADAWFMGYSPQLLAGTWIGCDDRFIRIESAQGYGGTAARPIWEAFFQKVYADKSLQIDRAATFAKPADLQNEIFSADIPGIIENAPPPGAEGVDQGVGTADEYGLDTTYEFMGPESKPVTDDSKKETARKDSSSGKKAPKIGDPATKPEEKKKGFFKKIFGGKNKEEPQNDY
ncbi:transglycosylase domain-containing protein [Chitinophagaceae bacterium LB-8]|uniref:Transglycosylase domain-containing protein n=1 Tax=Paraflavisolibacter caeni TaxID=2982496 RepID=A0A9X2Y0T8_9BACT|nr:transglycosylase domain-containing protein [Paraflavisolibacter caeni]MCU7552915.1 transglycosylase domain-containing protein [Paraflavisolibacter caeni]